jgi:hypothetical protein
VASREYQTLKLAQLAGMDLPEPHREALRAAVLAKSCICNDLAGTATRKRGIDPAATPAVCPGPNIVNFSRVATLKEMVGHIYGRTSLLNGSARPHMFLRELALYVDYLRNQLAQQKIGIACHPSGYFQEFAANLLSGIDYYRGVGGCMAGANHNHFIDQLDILQGEVQSLLSSESG